MSSGSNQLVTYSEVAAYQQTMGIETYNTPSDGRTPTGGYVVLWETDSGFTGAGWYFDDARSPAYSYQTAAKVVEEITNKGNLNLMFQKWSATVGEKLDFMAMLSENCVAQYNV